MDHFTKWAQAVAIPDQEAQTIAKAIVSNIFARHGVCQTLLSDRGRNFTSNLIKDICNLLGMKKIFTSPYRAQRNGQVERFHRTLHTGLSLYLDESGRDWDDHVDYILWAYRSQPHSITRYSPFYSMYGREMTGPHDTDLAAYVR
jgi:transposase InsO family protein